MGRPGCWPDSGKRASCHPMTRRVAWPRSAETWRCRSRPRARRVGHRWPAQAPLPADGDAGAVRRPDRAGVDGCSSAQIRVAAAVGVGDMEAASRAIDVSDLAPVWGDRRVRRGLPRHERAGRARGQVHANHEPGALIGRDQGRAVGQPALDQVRGARDDGPAARAVGVHDDDVMEQRLARVHVARQASPPPGVRAPGAAERLCQSSPQPSQLCLISRQASSVVASPW
jgi:hypothetical protein